MRLSLSKRVEENDMLLDKLRWMTSLLITPYAKHPISPQRLIKLYREEQEGIEEEEKLQDTAKTIDWDNLNKKYVKNSG